jgi:predicted  nucleic acid-binding Zn-ribbon protein
VSGSTPLRMAVVTEYEAELELLRAELADVREDLAAVETERDELRAAIRRHRSAIFREIGRVGSKMDRDLWAELDR